MNPTSPPPLAAYRQVTFTTDMFRLRPIDKQDQTRMYSWRSDAQTARFLSAPEPKSFAHQLDWFDRIRHNPAYCYHLIEERRSGFKAIGFVALINRDPTRPEAELGLVLGSQRGRGLGKILTPLACSYAFKLIGLRTLYTCIQPQNRAAIRQMEHLDAVLVEGTHRYRKPRELLFQIDSVRFDTTLSALAAQDVRQQGYLNIAAHFSEEEAP